jgi:hypothetical protein
MFRISVVCTNHRAVEFQPILPWQNRDPLFPVLLGLSRFCSRRTVIVCKDRDHWDHIALIVKARGRVKNDSELESHLALTVIME